MENACLSAIKNENNRSIARDLVFRCGVRADLKGCQYLIDAVIIYGSNLCTSFCRIYGIIGKLRGRRQKAVEHSISYAICQAPDIKMYLSKLIGVEVKESHNGLVISYLGSLFGSIRRAANDYPDTDEYYKDSNDGLA